MVELEILRRLALAVAVGLLIGIERGWQLRTQKDGRRVAGIRTYTLIGLSGGICGLLAGPDLLVLAIAFAGFAVSFALFEIQVMRMSRRYSATGLMAALLTFALGAYAVRGSMTIAGAAAVVAAVMLAERRVLHGFLRRLTWEELRAALLLLVMTVVLLPALPDRPVDPWGALNPYRIWLMTILIAAVSFSGYVAMKLAGERRGLLFAGLMGGLVTSTTVTWTFARLARAHESMRMEVTAAILGAWIVSLMRMAGIALVIAPEMSAWLLPPMAAAALVLLLPAVAAYLRAGRSQGHALPLTNPFDIAAVLKFGALLASIMLFARLAGRLFGESGLSVLGALSGILDVDPITLSMARLVQTGGTLPAFGASVILLAAFTNAISKAVLGTAFGGWRLGLTLIAAMSAASAAGAVFVFR
jgi:uncharacterized membrane protein (DUF4010 family)